MHLKLLQNESFKKPRKNSVIWLVAKLMLKLQNFQQIHKRNYSETISNENYKEIPKEKCVSAEERQEVVKMMN